MCSNLFFSCSKFTQWHCEDVAVPGRGASRHDYVVAVLHIIVSCRLKWGELPTGRNTFSVFSDCGGLCCIGTGMRDHFNTITSIQRV